MNHEISNINLYTIFICCQNRIEYYVKITIFLHWRPVQFTDISRTSGQNALFGYVLHRVFSYYLKPF